MKYPYFKQAFYTLLMKPLLLLLLGFNVRNLNRLKAGPFTLVAANHNSHLDAMVLMSLFSFRDLPKVKVVAAKDYFCKTPLTTWLSLNLIGIIPLDRKGEEEDPLAPVREAMEQGYTVIMFPEGSRGDPEKMQPLRFGVAKLLEVYPQAKIVPVYMHGLGKSLPRGQNYLVPFVCDINVGDAIAWQADKVTVMAALENSYKALAEEVAPKAWN